MNRSPVALLSLALLVAACAGKSSTSSTSTQTAPALSATVALEPNPPKVGHEKVTVTVKDAGGSPIRGAKVSIATNMPAMAMKGPALIAVDHGDGTYVTSADLSYATTWSFDATVSTLDGKKATAHVQYDVK